MSLIRVNHLYLQGVINHQTSFAYEKRDCSTWQYQKLPWRYFNYVVGILKFPGLKIQYPIEVKVDNIGAVYLSRHATTGNRTKHIDTRYHFVRNYIEDGTIKVVFVRSEELDTDVFIKNVTGELFNKRSEIIGDSAFTMANRRSNTVIPFD